MKRGIFIFNLVLIFFHGFSQTPPVVYIAGDGSGDFNCNGTSDQIEINKALDFVASHSEFTTVYIKGTNTYFIDEPIYISSNTIFEGDSLATLKLIDNAGWDTMYKSLIMQKGATNTIELGDTTNSVKNIIIRGFEIDGNRDKQTEPSGNSYYNIIKLQNVHNVTINNMYIHDNLADAVNIQSSYYGNNINLKFFKNRVHRSGHDGIYVGLSKNFEIYNNIFTDNRTDAHIRVQDCNKFKIYNNICGNNPINRNSGGIGIDVQVKGKTPLNEAEIFNNFIYGKGAYHGIWLWQTKSGGDLNTHKNVYIHHNIIYGNQASGIGIYGFNNTLIENNVIEFNGEGNNHSYTDNVLIGKQSGICFYKGKNKIKGFKTIVQNNIIGNNAAYGIRNKKTKTHTFISNYNCIYNNGKANYKDVSSKTDIYVYPDFACDTPTEYNGRIDYVYDILSSRWKDAINSQNFSGDMGAKEAWNVFHLKSEDGRWDGFNWSYDDITSFCINSGNPISEHINEAFPNGKRINIGAFGNTVFASKGNKIPNVKNFISYPNPTNATFKVSEEFINSEYYIYSFNGMLIKKGILFSNSIDISNLQNGIYFIKIKEYKINKWRTGKIVKIN